MDLTELVTLMNIAGALVAVAAALTIIAFKMEDKSHSKKHRHHN